MIIGFIHYTMMFLKFIYSQENIFFLQNTDEFSKPHGGMACSSLR